MGPGNTFCESGGNCVYLLVSPVCGELQEKGGCLKAARLAFATVLLLLAVRAFSQAPAAGKPAAGDSPRATVFIVPRPLGGEKDMPFLRILAAALEIELARAGLEARVPDALALPELSIAPPGRLLEEAGESDFLVLGGYTSTGQTLRMEIEVLRVEDSERVASAATTRRIDLRLDEAVGTVVERLVPQLQPHIAEAVRRRRQAAEAQPPVALGEPAVPAEAPVDIGAPGVLGEPPLPEEAAADTTPVASVVTAQPELLPTVEPAEAGQAPGLPRIRRLEVGAGGAAFFPMAGLDQLFRPGYAAEAYLDYLASTAAVSLAFGLYAGYTGLLPLQEGTASYFESLVPVGLGLRLGTPERSRLGVYVRLQAGAALNVSPQDKVEKRLTRVLPQVKAGAGLQVAFSPRLGMSLEFLYELLLYLYMKDGRPAAEPIMGFNVPAIFFYTRW